MFEPKEIYDPDDEILKEILDPEEWAVIEKWQNPKQLAKEIVDAALEKTGLTRQQLSGR